LQYHLEVPSVTSERKLSCSRVSSSYFEFSVSASAPEAQVLTQLCCLPPHSHNPKPAKN